MNQQPNRDRTTLIAVVVGVIALLLGLCLGAMAGGAGGFLLGRAAAREMQPERLVLPPTPQQAWPEVPATPVLPPQLFPGLPIQGGAFVQEVLTNTPAEAAGLRRGDVITQVGNTPIDVNHRLLDVLAQYKPGDKVMLTLWRSGRLRTLEVQLGAHPEDPKRPYLGIRYAEMPIPPPVPGD